MQKGLLYSLAFGCSLVILLLFSILLYNSINSLNLYSSSVEKSHSILFNLQKIQSLLKDSETGQRGFLLTKDSSFLEPLIKARTEIPEVLDSLLVLTRDNKVQHKNVQLLRESISETLNWIQETLPRKQYISDQGLINRLQWGKASMNMFRKQVHQIENQELALLEHRAHNKKNYERITPNYFKIIFSFTTVVAFISFLLLLNELRQRLASQSLLETKFHALNQSNSELQQIAHVTSHDLQEPLRKIRTFCDVLQTKYSTVLNDDSKAIVDRLAQNAAHMKELISDLSLFTSLAVSEDQLAKVDLNKSVQEVLHELSVETDDNLPEITMSALPVIRGFKNQLFVLFKELIENAIKFSKPDVAPSISITANHIRGKQLLNADEKYKSRNFIVINVSDNGIGFEQEYARKIFILFQRLHGIDSHYSGKGIGLAMCQRIMSNHNGFITTTSELNNGATFHLFFPV